jgi:hypothetical protein
MPILSGINGALLNESLFNFKSFILFLLINSIFILLVFVNWIQELIIARLEKTETFLYYERLFSLFQCVKVIRHFHLTYDDIIEKTKRANENYKEKTQILSYYILKCVYMFYINEYVDWCIENNGETLYFNKKNGSFEKTVQSYVVFLEKHYKLPEYLNAMKQFNNNIVIENTLRMSLFEI